MWLAPFDHSGNVATCNNKSWPTGNVWALHMSVIPRGTRQGWVLVWDNAFPAGSPVGVQRVHRWALVNPVAQQFENYCQLLPPGVGDMFCAGHCWTAEGNLLVAGGTKCHGTATSNCTPKKYEGSEIVYVWEPPLTSTSPPGGTWHRVNNMDEKRWYPSVVALGTEPITNEDRVMVLGGTNLNMDINSYQVWRPKPAPAGVWQPSGGAKPNTFAGPITNNYELCDYPRAHLMSALGSPGLTGRVMTAGFKPGSTRVNHYGTPAVWTPNWQQQVWPDWRTYGTSVLLPISPNGVIKDYVMAIGGKGSSILSSTEITNGGVSSSGSWANAASMAQPRWLCNSVLLPDSRVFVVGGEITHEGQGCAVTPALVPELYDPTMNIWVPMAPHTIIRDYHSTALLLADGTVLSAGGDSHLNGPSTEALCNDGQRGPLISGPSDYQRWEPYYLHSGNPRPVITTTPPAGGALAWQRGSSYVINHQALSYPANVAKAVLVRAGSVTHHADTNQRLVELELANIVNTDPPTPGFQPAVNLTVPTNASGLLPRGYYMLYLVSNQGVPSTAVWVHVT